MIEKAPSYKPEDFTLLEKGFLNTAAADSPFHKIERDYLYWDKIKYLNFENLTPESAWQITKTKRFHIRKSIKIGTIFSSNYFHYNEVILTFFLTKNKGCGYLCCET